MRKARPVEIRAAADVAKWLHAGMCLRRVPSPNDDDAAISRALIACVSELGSLPPAGVVADVATLLDGVRPAVDVAIPAADTVRASVRAYDDDVIARLVATPRFDDVLAAYAHLPPADKPTAIALVVGALCRRAGFTGVAVSTGALRRALARPRAERDTTGLGELRDHGDATTRLADAYLALARGARRAHALVDDREVFAIDHARVLGSLGRRLAADHIAAAAEALQRTLPRRLPPNRAHRGARDTQLADDSLYPAGGFSSITPGGATTGNIENLVSSELVYMEDDQAVDLFALRYVEGELLHYTRDDSVFRRHRHHITIALGPDLDDARVKDAGLPWQRLVMAMGLVVAAIRWLAEQLDDEALVVHVSFTPHQLVEERELMSLLLAGEIARGAVVIDEGAWDDVLLAATEGRATAIADAVVMSLGDPPDIPRGLRATHLGLASPVPVLVELGPRRRDVAPDLDADPWQEWSDTAEDLLRWLV